MPKTAPGAGAKQLAQIRLERFWMGAFLLSLVLVAGIFFLPHWSWGPMDEGYLIYDFGVGSWIDRIWDVFLPPAKKIFLFGTWRPLPYGLFFTIFTQGLGISPAGYHWVCGVGAALCALGFGWGIVALMRMFHPLNRSAIWLTAAMVWWCPSYLLMANFVAPDYWMQPGLLGLFWGLWLSDTRDLSQARIRMALGALAGFLALQCHESSLVLLLWTSGVLLVGKRLVPKRAQWKFGAFKTWGPAALAVLHAFLYRSLDPSTTNRTEIVTSTALADLWTATRYYLAMGTHFASEPVASFLGLSQDLMGAEFAPWPLAGVLAASGMVMAVRFSAQDRAIKPGPRLCSWVLVLAALGCTLPFLTMVNRYLYYYAIKMHMFIAAFAAVRLGWYLNGDPEKRARPVALAAALFIAGQAAAGFTVFYGWNWAKKYGAISLAFYGKVAALPGVEQCSQTSPCCLDIQGKGWLYNVATVNWCDGIQYPPRFVESGSPCVRTFTVQAGGY